MTDVALLVELVRAAVRAELQPLLQRLAPPVDPRHADLLHALAEVFGSAPFTASEAVDASRSALSARRRLQAALQAAGAHDAQRLGMVLATIEKRSLGRSARLQRLGTERGRRLWAVVDPVGPGS
jgi:hypothetical protein